MITKEKIEKRIEALTQAREQHLANANSCNGAIIEARFWLSELEKDDGNTDAAGDSN